MLFPSSSLLPPASIFSSLPVLIPWLSFSVYLLCFSSSLTRCSPRIASLSPFGHFLSILNSSVWSGWFIMNIQVLGFAGLFLEKHFDSYPVKQITFHCLFPLSSSSLPLSSFFFSISSLSCSPPGWSKHAETVLAWSACKGVYSCGCWTNSTEQVSYQV